jgi:hypothetical protein
MLSMMGKQSEYVKMSEESECSLVIFAKLQLQKILQLEQELDHKHQVLTVFERENQILKIELNNVKTEIDDRDRWVTPEKKIFH